MMNVYWLSILNSLSVLFIVGALLGVLIVGFSWGCAELDKEEWAITWAPRITALWLVFVVLAIAVPSRDSLVSSYVALEARKVLTAENASFAAKDLSTKLDKLLEVLGK